MYISKYELNHAMYLALLFTLCSEITPGIHFLFLHSDRGHSFIKMKLCKFLDFYIPMIRKLLSEKVLL